MDASIVVPGKELAGGQWQSHGPLRKDTARRGEYASR